MFWEQIVRHYKAGSAHQFLLHFNVNDLLYDEAYDYLPAMSYLMEQLNALGCDLVFGYNPTQGIIFPNIRQWHATQKMLEIVPQYEKSGTFHFQSLATWLQTLRRLQDAEDVNLADDEIVPQVVRSRINSNLAIGKLHEDSFATINPAPSEELQDKLHHLLRQDRAKVGLVINFLEQLAPNHPSLHSGANDALQRFLNKFQNWASDLDIRKRKHIILLVTQNTFDVHPSLTLNPEIPLVEIPFPDYAQRLQFIEYLHAISHIRSQMRKSLGDSRDRETFARETVGLNLFGVHDIARQAASSKEKASGELLMNYRRESVKVFSHGILEIDNPPANASVKGWYPMRAIEDIADGMRQRDMRRVPRGMLFLGPPGTGKMFVAKLLAGETNMTFVQLRYAGQVGEVTISINENGNSYERNLNAAINFIRGIVPVVVFMDEIEQASPRTSMQPEDVAHALPTSLVNAITDASLHGRVIWVGASSRPDLIPPIFRRAGIFDSKLILLPPTSHGRAEILRIYCEAYTHDLINFHAMMADARTDGITYQDLLMIVQRGHNIAQRNQRERLTEAELREALDDFIPNYSPEMQLFMGLLALREANSRALLPDALLPQYQEFVDGNRIDKTKINRRLIELSSILGLNA